MHKVIDVKPLEDYTILLTFENNKKKFDVKPYLKNFFKQLENKEYFKTDSLYEESRELN
ncbi:DUF2442 domain-containing protein [Allofrancisella guangzhouensis]|uniref:DUF2442 domain-containing protein n=1 Tax=Allofrancisella guangzhouensis TaxID=594679 RepID=UPI000A0434F4|nr:DUF2442 domain-containing protein [Allofrancisella guangzhouensis]MBK2026960.1 DUF2442 domain-containing protein [Allofrancisella guangzhouensis]MBK2044241.1 DUF2442 domain-containing protein [Allofrancisella guangzhouensis]MBK2045152.1 DUF2442 domain-containing protein [Allofrancisella guangzhouensis]